MRFARYAPRESTPIKHRDSAPLLRSSISYDILAIALVMALSSIMTFLSCLFCTAPPPNKKPVRKSRQAESLQYSDHSKKRTIIPFGTQRPHRKNHKYKRLPCRSHGINLKVVQTYISIPYSGYYVNSFEAIFYPQKTEIQKTHSSSSTPSISFSALLSLLDLLREIRLFRRFLRVSIDSE